MKDLPETDGSHEEDSSGPLAKSSACKANAFDFWLSRYQRQLAVVCSNGPHFGSAARDEQGTRRSARAGSNNDSGVIGKVT
jgi:hypothetical protein